MRASRWGGHFGCLEATYEESKRGPKIFPGLLPHHVWKLPMRNPSRFIYYIPGPRDACLEATYEESKLHHGEGIPRVRPRRLEATYEESKRWFKAREKAAIGGFGSYL